MASDNEQSTLGSIVSKVANVLTPGVDSDGAPKETGDITSLHEMRDPLTMYPRPHFIPQPQNVPGLDAEMHPKPDHGEKSYVGSGKLPNRKALITGGDSGIGRAAAIAFAREGADVTINYLPEEEKDAQETLALIKAAGRKGFGIPGDIKSETFCQQLVETAVREMGGLDIVVNNAGKQHATEAIADLTTEQFDATFKTNVYAMFWITKAAVPHLPKGATIINTTSIQGFDPSESLLDYAQTKASQIAFTRALAQQLAEKGIRVNAVAPGPIWTALQVSGGQPQKKIVSFGSETPLKRPGQPVELAPVYVLLAGQESSYTTGHVYGVTGGLGQP